ncbi:MAG: hypothetical protein EA397_01005 [Deltaproteobacteria bacterium]|nr:MAG: hypothetical protein EA397_01005 [Deltaproteobacteria bacterium]
MQLPRAALCGLVLALPFMLSASADADLWWHVAAGDLIVTRGGLPETDPWSYTFEGEPWINHEWLPGIVLYLAHSLGGELGLLGVRAATLLVLMTTWLLAVERRLEIGAASILLIGLPWPLLSILANLRPQTLTWALVPATVVLVDQAARGRWWSLFALPATLVLWANAHGGFLFGWGVAGLGLGLVALGFESDRQPNEGPTSRRFRLASFGAALAVALTPFLTPNGLDLPRYIWTELTVEHPGLPEWNPPSPTMLAVLLCAALLPFAIGALNRRRVRPTAWIALAIATIQALQHAKFTALVLLLAPICLAEVLGPDLRARLSRDFDLDFLGRSPVGLGAALLLALAIGSPMWPEHAGRIPVNPKLYPTRAIEWLDGASSPREGTLMTPLGWGGIAIYHLSPRWRVGIDGRNTTVYSPAFVQQISHAWDTGDLSALPEPPPTAFLGQTGTPLIEALAREASWEVVYEDETATVLMSAQTQVEGPGELKTSPFFP